MAPEKVTLNMYEADVWPLFCSAFRYALGRMTYTPGMITRIIEDNRGLLQDWQRRQIVREIWEYKAEHGEIGSTIDTAMWERFAAKMERDE